MFKNIDWSQTSTKRGIVWVVTFIIGMPMAYMGKDVTQLLLLAGGVVGGMGVLTNDK